jgi:hypothetical protein
MSRRRLVTATKSKGSLANQPYHQQDNQTDDDQELGQSHDAVEVAALQAQVNGQRHCLRQAHPVPDEHDGGPRVPGRPGLRQHRASAQDRQGKRHGPAPEGAPAPVAERRRGVFQGLSLTA